MAELILEGVTRLFGSVRAVDGVTFTTRSGELLSILGPSGCGKSTILNMIAGFVRPSAGTITLGGRALNDVPPNRRGIGIVFQSYALFPHMTVFDNVAFGLRMRRAGASEVTAQVRGVLAMVRLQAFEARYPRQLSGGEQQRVALARALVINPTVLLLDEPLAALDKQIRQSMQMELRNLQRSTGVTALFVTHDQEEAMVLSDRIVVMREGRVVQCDEPDVIYHRPATRFVAGFIGRSNFLEGDVVSAGGGVAAVRLAGGGGVIRARSEGVAAGRRVTVAVRPERIALEGREVGDDWNRLSGTVAAVIDLGPAAQILVDVEGVGRLEASVVSGGRAGGRRRIRPGNAVGLHWLVADTAVVAE